MKCAYPDCDKNVEYGSAYCYEHREMIEDE